MKNHRYSRPLGLLVIPTLCFAAACSDQDPAVTEASQAQALDSAAPRTGSTAVERVEPPSKDGKRFRGRFHHGGGNLFKAALKHLDLTEEQRAQVVELKSSLRPDREKDAPGPRQTLKTALKQSLETGSLDRPAIDKALADLDTRFAERTKQHATALNQLHALLTPEQRTALVQTLQKSPKHGKSDSNDRPHHGKFKHAGKHGFGMLRGIDLTEAQQEKLKAMIAESDTSAKPFQELRSQRAKLLEAFATPNFDSAKLADSSLLASQARQRAERHVAFVTQAMPVLNAEQRAQLAERMGKQHEFGHKRWGKGR